MTTATFDQRTGMFAIWTPVDDGGIERCIYERQAYAGRGGCKNNPDCEHIKDCGPLPLGAYGVLLLTHHPRFADPVFLLTQTDGPTYGRSGFLIHGESRERPGEASTGCIILDRVGRTAVAEFAVSRLEVVASQPQAGTRTIT